MGFKIVYLACVTKDDIPALPKTMRERIRTAVNDRLGVDPKSYGKPLQKELRGLYRLRVGDYRVIYEIDFQENTVIISAIKHRRYVYYH